MSDADTTAAPRTATLEDLRRVRRQRLRVELDLGDEVVTFVFEALPGVRYDELLAAHRAAPTEEYPLPFEADGFAPALLAASSVDPVLDDEAAKALLERLDGPAMLDLFFAVLALSTLGSGNVRVAPANGESGG